jgi:hypothetical protein
VFAPAQIANAAACVGVAPAEVTYTVKWASLDNQRGIERPTGSAVEKQ